MPALLLDAHLSHALAAALQSRGIDVQHVALQRDGRFRTADNATLLRVAAEDRRVLVTQDTATVPLDAFQLLADDAPCAGVLVLSSRIGQADVGKQLAAILAEIALHNEQDWTGLVVFAGRR